MKHFQILCLSLDIRKRFKILFPSFGSRFQVARWVLSPEHGVTSELWLSCFLLSRGRPAINLLMETRSDEDISNGHNSCLDYLDGFLVKKSKPSGPRNRSLANHICGGRKTGRGDDNSGMFQCCWSLAIHVALLDSEVHRPRADMCCEAIREII